MDGKAIRHNYVDKHGYEWDVMLNADIPVAELEFTEGQQFDEGVSYTVIHDGVRVGGAFCQMKSV